MKNWWNRKINLHVKRTKSFCNSAEHCVSGVQFLRALLFNFRKERIGFRKELIGQDTKLLPLREMAEDFGLVRKSMRPKLGRRSFITPEGKVALMFLKMYTGLSCPKLLEQLNGNIHYQIFCDVIIDLTRSLTNYKLLDDIMLELVRVRATVMEGSFGTQKEHYDHRNVNARTMPDKNSPETTGNGCRLKF